MAEEVSVFLLSNPLFYLYFTKNMSPSPQSGPQKYYGTFSQRYLYFSKKNYAPLLLLGYSLVPNDWPGSVLH